MKKYCKSVVKFQASAKLIPVSSEQSVVLLMAPDNGRAEGLVEDTMVGFILKFLRVILNMYFQCSKMYLIRGSGIIIS